MKRLMSIVLVLMAVVSILLSACAPTNSANIASRNISQEADQFRIMRRVVFYNGITDEYILEVTGLCSLGNFDANGELSVTCKTGQNSFVKHYLGLSDNVTYFAEQLEGADVSTYHYKVIFKPASIVPQVELDLGGN